MSFFPWATAEDVAQHLGVAKDPFIDIKALKVPLPIPAHQKDLAQALNDAVNLAKSKRTEATALRSATWDAFESALFTSTERSAA